ncbi:acyl-CoA dehydrogenase [Nesterenkonia salmonea]|uniref:Acyl-CoA dehydrogenase n=1 Tax=Nesterenkonia salmonea TaxID=1804987 RepID=A0A5R9B8Y0_9MICC|nr:acyl-CoA dehydrogenase family protein [Nesterenkonia salmonea]TLP92705.1 acyl-CoA dehydrogenase [Nesterenkonia salmonea]
MDFAHDPYTIDLAERVRAFIDDHVLPAEPILDEQLADTPDDWSFRPIVDELRTRARADGLWNLFLPSEGGAGLTNLQYAPLAEITGWSQRLGPVAFNCAAPDTGNMELLADFGTPEQKRDWLEPLLDARMRSAFCMTEPEAPSSDATQISTQIRREGSEVVITGRKWWATGAMNPEAELLIVRGKTDPEAARHRQQSMVIVPRDTPGVRIVRPLTVFGYDDRDHGGHAEIVFDQVRVPAENVIGGEGEGFAIAQARLGPGRIHHCMRTLGMAERALALAGSRARQRSPFGRPLAEQGVVREWIAESRIELESLRLLVLKTAWLMDTVGNRQAMAEIQSIKIAVPRAAQRILDRVIQIFAAARALRLADGPDEVHLSSLGKAELRP